MGSNDALELKIPPLAVAAIIAGAMWGASSLLPALAMSIPAASIIAAVMTGVGACISAAGVVEFRRRRTTVNPTTPHATTTVVTTGVYRLTRNPMYLGFLIALAAWAVYLSNAAAALLLPAYVAYMNRFQIRPEERALVAGFGPGYAEYMARVRRWI